LGEQLCHGKEHLHAFTRSSYNLRKRKKLDWLVRSTWAVVILVLDMLRCFDVRCSIINTKTFTHMSSNCAVCIPAHLAAMHSLLRFPSASHHQSTKSQMPPCQCHKLWVLNTISSSTQHELLTLYTSHQRPRSSQARPPAHDSNYTTLVDCTCMQTSQHKHRSNHVLNPLWHRSRKAQSCQVMFCSRIRAVATP
jgi:hypothetical protein